MLANSSLKVSLFRRSDTTAKKNTFSFLSEGHLRFSISRGWQLEKLLSASISLVSSKFSFHSILELNVYFSTIFITCDLPFVVKISKVVKILRT